MLVFASTIPLHVSTMVLSPRRSSNCVPPADILQGVVTFGQALRTLRGTRKPAQVARAALGPAASAQQQRDTANYFARIERDQVPNVGLPQLRLLATGLGYASLGPFFAALDAIEARAGGLTETGGPADTNRPPAAIDRPSPLHPAPRSTGGGLAQVLVGHESDSLSAAEADRAILTRLAAALINVTAAAEPRRQAATPRRKPPKRVARDRSHRR